VDFRITSGTTSTTTFAPNHNKNNLFSLVIVSALLISCAKVDQNIKLTSTNSEHSTLLIYREKNKFLGIGASPFLGTDAGYFAQLENGQYIELPIDSGSQTLLSKSETDIAQPNEITLLLTPNTTHCVKATYNVNIGINLGATVSAGSQSKGFALQETNCPSPDILNQLTKVEVGHTVEYANN